MSNSIPLSNFTNASDAQLVETARLGNKKAFVEIVHRYQNLVTGVTLAILRDFALSEDAAQESFVQAWQKMSTLKKGEKLPSWLCQIARNTALNHSRKRRLEDALEPSLVDPSPRPDELAISRDERANVLSALNSLPEKYRLPLVLYYREDQSIRSVAKALSQSEATVRKQLSRGRNLLKEQMTDLLKSTLPRTIPGPVFTATVAGLIGAMLKPTAVAATAFSTKPLTASATAMTTSKLTLTTAAIITAVCIPVGYTARALIPTQEVSTPVEITTAVPTSKRETYDPAFSPIAREWQELLASCNGDPKAFPDLYQTISEIPGSLRREAFLSLLIAEWVKLDPNNGLTFIRGQKHSLEQQELFAKEWIKYDANAAIDGLLRGGPGWDPIERIHLADLQQGKGWNFVLGRQLSEIGTRAPGQLKKVVEALPLSTYYNSYGAFANFYNADPKAALEVANSLQGRRKRSALGGIASAWGKQDFEAAMTWAESHEDPLLHHSLIRNITGSLAYQDPLKVLQYLKNAPPGMSFQRREAIGTLANKDLPTALRWIAQNPDRQTIEEMRSEFSNRLQTDPVALIDIIHKSEAIKAVSHSLFGNSILQKPSKTRSLVWNKLLELKDDPGAVHLRKKMVSMAYGKEPDSLMNLVNQMPAGPEQQFLIKEAAKNIAKHAGPNSESTNDFFGEDKRNENDFSEVIDQAPEGWKGPLVEEAFKSMKAEQFAQSELLDRWEEYFDQLPDTGRTAAAQKLATGIALRSPDRMAAFFVGLKTDKERLQAGIAFMEISRKSNSETSKQWLENTPMDEELRTKIREGKSSAYDPFQ